MTMYFVSLNNTIFTANAEEFLVYGEDEMDAIYNLYEEGSPRFTKFLISRDEFNRMVQRWLPEYKYNEEAAYDAVLEDYIDLGNNFLYAEHLKVEKAPRDYQIMDEMGLELVDDGDDKIVVVKGSQEPLVGCWNCDAVVLEGEFLDGYDEYGDFLYHEICPVCGKHDGYHYIDVGGAKLLHKGAPKMRLASASIKSRLKAQPKRPKSKAAPKRKAGRHAKR